MLTFGNMAPVTEGLTDLQREIFTKISQNEVSELKALFAQNKIKIDFVDENGMSPLQHACYKGNKEVVQMLLDQVGLCPAVDCMNDKCLVSIKLHPRCVVIYHFALKYILLRIST